MTLDSITEALLIASAEALGEGDIARIVRARAEELSDESIIEAPDFQAPKDSAENELDLAALASTGPEDVRAAIERLNQHYQATGRAFHIVPRAKGWKIFTRADYGGFARLLFPRRKAERLSAPAMETLAIIAYRQPVTKAALEAVRGVSCDGMLQKLLDRELVKIAGRAELPGRPLLYQTTELFLEHFGITAIDELPNLTELRQVELPDQPTAENPAHAEEQLALSGLQKPPDN